MSDQIALTAAQRQLFLRLREHNQAPNYNFASTDLLTPARLEQVKAFEREVKVQRFWQAGSYPEWLGAFTERVTRSVPFYRGYGRPPRTFEAIPTMGREVLQEEPWSLVPDDLSLEALTVYTTSGTSGSELAIPTHPNVSSMYLVLIEELLEPFGIALPRGPERVAIALVQCQQKTLTYPSLSQYLGGAGFLKLNLAEHEWRQPQDRAEFLRDAAPGVITGSPYAFEVLASIAPDLRPQALVSSAVALHPGQATRLEEVFRCPVFDLYSMTEARAIAGRRVPGDNHFRCLSQDLYVEILGPEDEPLPPGEVGEIVLTGGRNPYFPLLRYRTGDRAALTYVKGRPHLTSFEGRQDVHLESKTGGTISTLDVVHVLRDLPLVGFSLAQKGNREVHFDYCGVSDSRVVQERLEALFGSKVEVSRLPVWQGKPHRFQSELTFCALTRQ